MIEDYFKNVVSKIWLGEKNQGSFTMVSSEIQDIFLNLSLNDKEVFLGKTEKFYFILNGIDEDGFRYGILFLNTSLKNLILSYKDRSIFNAEDNIDIFIDNLELNYRLNKKLVEKNIKIKKFKI